MGFVSRLFLTKSVSSFKFRRSQLPDKTFVRRFFSGRAFAET